ncbi:MAG: aminopeptidase P N-terminal domain-containing protein, partial [Bacteroidota bacterium]
MRMKLVWMLMGLPALVWGQERPDDYLSAAFHADRRAAVRDQLPPKSVALFFANPVRNRANDVDYVYHQDPDFYYLTGILEPHAVLVLSKDEIAGPDGEEGTDLLFVQSRNRMAEMWTGRRLGAEGAATQTGMDAVYAHEQFADWKMDFTRFDKVLILGFAEDVRDGRSDSDLYDLIDQFKEKAAYPEDFDPKRYEIYSLIRTTDL